HVSFGLAALQLATEKDSNRPQAERTSTLRPSRGQRRGHSVLRLLGSRAGMIGKGGVGTGPNTSHRAQGVKRGSAVLHAEQPRVALERVAVGPRRAVRRLPRDLVVGAGIGRVGGWQRCHAVL